MHHVGRISIIGAGTLGSTIAFSLLSHDLADEILLVDMSQTIVHGQVLDLSEASFPPTVRAGTFKEAGQSSLVIFTADTTDTHKTRQDWLAQSRHLLLGIASSMSPLHTDILILVVSDPVDLYVQSLQSYFPHIDRTRIFGLGTTMATGRFQHWLSSFIEGDISDAYCIGARETPIVLWSHAKVSGVALPGLPLLMSQRATLEKIVTDHRTHLIHERKGVACFGVAAYVTRMVEQVSGAWRPREPTRATWVVSGYVPLYDCCLSWPVRLGASGIEKVMEVPLDPDEHAQVAHVVASNKYDFQSSQNKGESFYYQ